MAGSCCFLSHLAAVAAATAAATDEPPIRSVFIGVKDVVVVVVFFEGLTPDASPVPRYIVLSQEHQQQQQQQVLERNPFLSSDFDWPRFSGSPKQEHTPGTGKHDLGSIRPSAWMGKDLLLNGGWSFSIEHQAFCDP